MQDGAFLVELWGIVRFIEEVAHFLWAILQIEPLGHLPRRIEPHPTDPCLTRETCLRCRVVLDRDRVTGAEREVPR